MAFIFLLSVGTVNAADNETDDVVSVTNQEPQSNNDYISFRNLQDVPLNLIDTYENKSNGDSKEVLINKNITINNKDYILLDEHDREVIFCITNPNNITFVNTNNHAVHVGSTASNYVVSDHKTDIDVVDVKLTINTTANVTCVGNNTLVEFTIIVNNEGIVDATGVYVRDGLPDGFSLVNVTEGYNTTFNCWIVDNLSAGESIMFTLIGRSVEIGNWTNYAYALCDENDTLINDTIEVDVVPVVLTINKTANATCVGNNTLVEFTIIVNNTSIVDATDVLVKDGLPSVFDFVNATEGYDTFWNEWIIDLLHAGQSVTLTIIGRSSEIYNYTNYAYAECNENDTLIRDTFKGQIVPTNLTIIKSASPTNVTVGENVTFTVTVTNNGLINVTDVRITDALDSAFKFDGSSTSVPCNVSGNELVWNIGDMVSKSSKTIAFNVSTIAIGNFTNEATVTCHENATGKSNRTNVIVNPGPSLVSGENVTMTYGEDINIDYVSINATGVTYAIFDYDGNLVFGDTVGPYGSIAVNHLASGNYTVNWTSVVDENHISSTNASTIEVKKSLPPINVEAPTVTVGENGIITVTVPADATGNITIEVDGKNYTEPVNDGKAVFVVPGLKDGLYNISAHYSGDDNYLPNNATGTIEILRVYENNVTPKDAQLPIKSAFASHETANPIIALLMVLTILAINVKRRKLN